MSIFQSLIKKEILHLLRDFRTVTVVLVIPVVLLLLFGFAISTEVNQVRVVAVVEQYTEETKQIIDQFRANSYFAFEGVVSPHDVESLLRKGRADAAVVFRWEDGRLKHQIIVDASNTNLAQTATAYLESVIRSATGSLPVVTHTLYNPQLQSAYNFVPGIMGMIFILICAMMTSVSIVSEKESGTMNLLLVSPVRPRTIILGKLVDSCLGLGIAGFHHRLHTGSRLADFRRDVHDSRGTAVRHDLPCGEHAASAAMVHVYHPGTLVHCRHPGTDDPATSRRVCADGSPGPGRNDDSRAGLGHQEVQC